jgi:hypothetical protein
MIDRYRHTQFGLVTIVALVAAIATVVFLNETGARGPALLFAELALLACLALFYSLTVEVDHDAVSLRFGVGLIRRRFLLAEIATTEAVRNRWFHGWGIRRIRGGWLFNVSGFDAIEIGLTDGRRYRIGTDEPDRLLREIRCRQSGAAGRD